MCRFFTSLSVRDRLMHPRSHESMKVSDDEIVMVVKSSGWFFSQVCEVIKPLHLLDSNQ